MSQRREFLKTVGVVAASALISQQPLVAEIAGGENEALDFGSGLLDSQASSAGPAAPMELLVNGVKSPLAIDRDATRFTWRAVATGRGETQTAYQILVFSSRANLFAGMGDWWDSGKVASNKSASVEYAGRTLPPAARFWWKVRIWNQTGKASPYSVPAFFDTGLNQNEWKANYIGWNDQPEQLRLLPKGIFSFPQARPCQGLCHCAQRLSSLFQWASSGPVTGSLQSLLLRTIQCLRHH